MKKNIYLHVGSGKTGTTSIQLTLHRNSDILYENGYLYDIESDISHSNIFSWTAQMPDDIERYFYALKERMITDKKIHTAIISSENMMGLDIELLHMIKFILNPEIFNVVIVAYIRNQIEHIPSHYLQKQKDPFQFYCGSINNFFKEMKHIYGNEHNFIMNNYGSIFGHENIIVRIYDRSLLMNNDSVEDFLNIFNLNDIITKRYSESNISLIPHLSQIIESMDTAIPSLLDKNHIDFKYRQDVLIKILLEISKEYKNNMPNDCIKSFTKFKDAIQDKFDIEIWKNISTTVEDTKSHIVSKSTIKLIDISLKHDILKYYESSNKKFANIYLDDKQKNKFLKYYH